MRKYYREKHKLNCKVYKQLKENASSQIIREMGNEASLNECTLRRGEKVHSSRQE